MSEPSESPKTAAEWKALIEKPSASAYSDSPSVLLGNYDLDAVTLTPEEHAEKLRNAFERLATSRLGGSICYVKGGAFLWKGPKQEPPPSAS